MLIVEVRVEDIELISLDSLRWGVVFIVMHGIIFIPLNCHSLAVYILWLESSKAAFGLTGSPVIKLLFIFLKSLVFLKFNDLFCNHIVCLR